jgi:hypothetical protein
MNTNDERPFDGSMIDARIEAGINECAVCPSFVNGICARYPIPQPVTVTRRCAIAWYVASFPPEYPPTLHMIKSFVRMIENAHD